MSIALERRRYMGSHGTTDIYQTYDFLEVGANLPYINTLYIPTSETIAEFQCYVPSSGQAVFFGSRISGSSRQYCLLYLTHSSESYRFFRVDRNSSLAAFALNIDDSITNVMLGINSIEINSVQMATLSALSPSPPYYLYLMNINNAGSSVSTDSEGLRMYETRFYTSSGDDRDFVPCQLLQDTDQTWDGATHYAGECGMWDSVTDKFYGNANSSGSFTVGND